MNILSNLNLNKNELQNLRVHNISANPSSPVTGQFYYNTSDNILKVYNGSQWLDLAVSTGQSTITGVTGTNGVTASTAGGVVTIQHADTSSQASVNNSGVTVIQDLTLDGFGHITAIGSTAISLANLGFTGATDADNYGGFTISGNTGTSSNIDGGDTIIFNGDGISTSVSLKTVTINNSDKGSSQNIFKNIAADSGTNTVADSNNDTLTIAGGDGVNTSSNSTNDTITVALDSSVVRTSGNQTIEGVKTFENDAIFNGNVTISGSFTTTVSETVNVEDNILFLNSNLGAITPTEDSGFVINRGSSDNVGLIWDESADEFSLVNVGSYTGGSITNVTINSRLGLRVSDLFSTKLHTSGIVSANSDTDRFLTVESGEVKYVSGANLRSYISAGTVNSVAVSVTGPLTIGATTSITSTGTFELGINDASTTAKGVVELATSTEARALSSTAVVVTPASLEGLRARANVGDGTTTSFAITHNLDSRDVIVQLYDNSTYENVITDIVRNTVNQVTVSFNSAPTTDQFRVLIYKV